MKKSSNIKLILIGGLASGALSGCSDPPAYVSADAVYTNNAYVPGVGYYHAPYRAWYQHPYNHFDAAQGKYYLGGRWESAPDQSIVNISHPKPEAAAQAEAQRTDVQRGGFGSSSRSSHVWS